MEFKANTAPAVCKWSRPLYRAISNCSVSIHRNGVLMSHLGVLRAPFSNVSQNPCLNYRFSSDPARRLCGHDFVTPHRCSTVHHPARSRNANSQSERRLRLPTHGYECPRYTVADNCNGHVSVLGKVRAEGRPAAKLMMQGRSVTLRILRITERFIL